MRWHGRVTRRCCGARSLDVVHVWAPPSPVSEVSAMASFTDEPAYEKAARDLVAAAADEPCPRSEGPDDPWRPVRSGAIRLPRCSSTRQPSPTSWSWARAATVASPGSCSAPPANRSCTTPGDPVAVVPPTAPLPGQGDVVVGVDGSEGSRDALRWAVDEAAARGARLSVVHGWWTPYPIPPGGLGLAPAEPEQFTQQSEKLMREMIDDAVAHAGRHPAAIELLPVQEPAAPALLGRAKDADLLVVGSRGRGGFTGLLLGSTSQQCVHHSTSAVVVVPNPG